MIRIAQLKIVYHHNGHPFPMYPAILEDENGMVLVDCCFPGFADPLIQAGEKANIDLKNLTDVIVTHHDFDHFGGYESLKEKFPSIRLMASSLQADYIEGTKTSLRVKMMQERETTDQAVVPKRNHIRRDAFPPVRFAHVDVRLSDAQELPVCGGAVIIETPGHMPGHISIYMKQFKTLISGDALVLRHGVLGLPDESSNTDHLQTRITARKLSELDIEQIFCFHGGCYCSEHIREELTLLSEKE